MNAPMILAKPPKSDWSPPAVDMKAATPETWDCVDCGVNTAPGCLGREQFERAFAYSLKEDGAVTLHITRESEVYGVKPAVWKKAGMEVKGGCLCIGCLEKRIGRTLTPKDFPRNHAFDRADIPGTIRLISRRNGVPEEVIAKLRAERERTR